ncbi:putative leucine-rich repeat-containing protein [Senna tora]|uniref:Putative leucine-rich repeat-containing protein n=1 Tax=Senna tora TaxID=362788 RepID=A0A834XCD5_9FABA|nr:putative leucine-rich repeat-containing protein [Senna tora]
MPKRKGRGRPKKPSVGKTQQSEDSKLDILAKQWEMLEAEGGSGFGEEQEAETSTMPKRMRLGVPRGSTVQNRFQESADGYLDIRVNPSNSVQVGSHGEGQEADKMKGPGRSRGSEVQKKFQLQESDYGNLDALISNIVGNVLGRGEQQAVNIPTKKGRGRPRGSTSLKNFQRSADGNLDILTNPSNLVEIGTGFEEEQLADTDASTAPMKKGRGRPKGSMGKKRHQESADGNLGGMINTYGLVEVVGPGQGGEDQEADMCITLKRRGRGPTRGLTLQMKRQQSADGKLDVIIHPTKMVAVGPGRKDFITDLSVIVRQNARHNVSKWKRVPQSVRDTIVQKILDNWRLPDTVLVRKAIIDEAGRLYRNWRNRLHSYYLNFATKEEALKHVPDDINSADWKCLVDYFSSPAFETMSAKNKANKAKQTFNHACGPKSFQAVSYDARDEETGKEPDLHKLWQLTHKRANGEWVDEASKEIHEKVTQQIVEKLNELEDSGTGDEVAAIEPEVIESAFKSLVGKRSYMQGLATGGSVRVQVEQLRAELEAQKKETEEAKKMCNEARAKLVEVESQLVEERQRRKEAENRLRDRQSEILQINTQVQTAIEAALSQHRLPMIEAEGPSRQNRKLTELESQLHEAEDVITELRADASESWHPILFGFAFLACVNNLSENSVSCCIFYSDGIRDSFVWIGLCIGFVHDPASEGVPAFHGLLWREFKKTELAFSGAVDEVDVLVVLRGSARVKNELSERGRWCGSCAATVDAAGAAVTGGTGTMA